MQLTLYLILNLIWALNYVTTQSYDEGPGEYPDSKPQISKEDISIEENDESFYPRKAKPKSENQSYLLTKMLTWSKPLEEAHPTTSDNTYKDIEKNVLCFNDRSACLDIDNDKQWRLFYDKCSRTKNIAHMLSCGAKYIERDYGQDYTEIDVKKRNAPKRLPFHSWGGKRTNQVGTEKIQASRVPFNAWGGKRTYKENTNKEQLFRKICCIHLRMSKQNIQRFKDNFNKAFIESDKK